MEENAIELVQCTHTYTVYSVQGTLHCPENIQNLSIKNRAFHGWSRCHVCLVSGPDILNVPNINTFVYSKLLHSLMQPGQARFLCGVSNYLYNLLQQQQKRIF